MEKGKAKMPKYEDDQSDGNKLTPSLGSEFGVPIMQTPGVKKAFSSANEKLRRSRVKNPVTRFGYCHYNEYMAHHYAFMLRIELNFP